MVNKKKAKAVNVPIHHTIFLRGKVKICGIGFRAFMQRLSVRHLSEFGYVMVEIVVPQLFPDRWNERLPTLPNTTMIPAVRLSLPKFVSAAQAH